MKFDKLMTIGLPVYNSKKIVFLALEGIKRQNGKVPFELIINDCPDEDGEYSVIGNKTAEKLLDKISKMKNCSRVKVLRNDQRIQLSRKWVQIIEAARPNSIGLILQAADCFSHADRLQETWNKLHQGYDWYQQRSGRFYDINLDKMIRFDSIGYSHPCSLNMAVSMELARKIKHNSGMKHVWSCVDSWLYDQSQQAKGDSLKVYEDQELDREGVDTNGYNTISSRGKWFRQPVKPFYISDLELEDLLPTKTLARKVRKLKKK